MRIVHWIQFSLFNVMKMISTKVVLCQFLFLLFMSMVKHSIANIVNPQSSCPIYLTISLQSINVDNSSIIINWGPGCMQPPQWIGLYDKDPSIFNLSPKAYVKTNNNQTGKFDTNVHIGQLNLPNGWNRDEVLESQPLRISGKCLPFYVASYNDKALISMDCLKIQPNWMSISNHLMDVPLKNIFIPGTHCSGCFYQKSNGQNVLVEKFGFTQNFDVWTQLVLGIRYLDISVGYNEDFMALKNESIIESNRFWIVNDNLFITPISDILDDVRRFIVMSGEMVIFDFHKFPIGFNQYPERHIHFLKYLENKLGDVAYRNDHVLNSYDLTINHMIATGKSLLVAYNKPDMKKETDLIWPSWRRFSTKDLKSTEIKEYMRKVFTKKYEGSPNENIGWSFFGIQGVESSYTNGDSLPTARERADRINHNISIWLGGPWSLSANVVALDYFFSTNLIDIAIHSNHHKSSQTSDLVSFDMDFK